MDLDVGAVVPGVMARGGSRETIEVQYNGVGLALAHGVEERV